jgi:hypothetical protein
MLQNLSTDNTFIKYNKINVYEISENIKQYLSTIHPKHSNGFIIRILDEDIENSNYERRRSYIVTFPKINDDNKEIEINNVLSAWAEYAITNVVENYDCLKELSILSIDPINVLKNITEINVQFSGCVSNPEILIRNITFDIIQQMNKHIIEYYMDNNHPDIDISNSDDLEKFNEVFNDVDIETIYNMYPIVEVYVPIEVLLKNDINKKNNLVFYLNGTILTTTKYVDIINDIRKSLDFDDKNELLKYDKDEIVFKFSKKIKKIIPFAIITDADI